MSFLLLEELGKFYKSIHNGRSRSRVIEHNDHLSTRGKCRKPELQASVFFFREIYKATFLAFPGHPVYLPEAPF